MVDARALMDLRQAWEKRQLLRNESVRSDLIDQHDHSEESLHAMVSSHCELTNERDHWERSLIGTFCAF